MDNKKENLKNNKKAKALTALLIGAATLNTIKDGSDLIKSKITEGKEDKSGENKVGHEGYNTRFNTEVHSNNFVVLHISDKTINDITNLRKTLNQCKDRNISVSLVLDTSSVDLARMNKDIDFLQAILKQYQIDMPVYCNIDSIMNSKILNNAEKTTLIEAFLDKTTRSNMYVGLYGTDTNLRDCNEYITDITGYDTFLVQDSDTITYTGTHNVTKDLDGKITASIDLSEIIKESNLNSSTSLVYSQGYKVKENETLHTIALKCGLSENDLKEYNNITSVKEGDTVYIPNMYMILNKENNKVSYNYAIARGIDISDYQSEIDWDRVEETTDYVIVEVARDDNDYKNNDGYYLESAIDQIKNTTSKDLDLGLYFCVLKDMDKETYEGRINTYLKTLETEMKENNVTLNKNNVPLFLDFEFYTDDNDYYELLSTFEKVCNSYGYTKVGVYANDSVLNSICKNMTDKHNKTLKNTNLYVWKAGGPQYSSSEHTDLGVSVDDLIEYRGKSSSNYTVDMQQVTNVCNDTGASNTYGHCDVSYLYDEEMFGHTYSEEEIESVMEVDLNNYKDFPIASATTGTLNTISSLTASAYAVIGLKLLAKKLKEKNKDNIFKRKLK